MIGHLSPRERDIALRMAEGYCYSEIAAQIGWQPASVRVAAHRMAERLPGRGSPIVRILRWAFEQQREAA